MTDREVIESFDNAWRAMCRQYRKNPTQELQSALNMLGRILSKVKTEVEKSHREGQITIGEWLEMLGVKED